MSLVPPTREQILANISNRWPKFCLDSEIWNLELTCGYNPMEDWLNIKFDKGNIPYFIDKDLDGQEGIYMFVLKPENRINKNHTFILYIGETSNLKQRFESYFNYENTDNPSDQLKRKMIVLWKDYLHFYYIKTDYGSKRLREQLEYDLIDKLVPPINDKFRSKALKAHIKHIK